MNRSDLGSICLLFYQKLLNILCFYFFHCNIMQDGFLLRGCDSFYSDFKKEKTKEPFI